MRDGSDPNLERASDASATPLAVLHVEDDVVHAKLVTRLLASAGGQFRATNINTLRDAMIALDRAHWDVCLLDLGLPDSVGLATLRKILTQHPDVAVVVLTGEGDPWLALAAIKMGAEDFLIKDHLDLKSLTRSMMFACARSRRDLTAPSAPPQLNPRVYLDGLPLPVGLVNAEHQLIYANRAWLVETGQAGDTLSGAPLSWLASAQDDTVVDFPRLHARPRRMRLRRSKLAGIPGQEVICLCPVN